MHVPVDEGPKEAQCGGGRDFLDAMVVCVVRAHRCRIAVADPRDHAGSAPGDGARRTVRRGGGYQLSGGVIGVGSASSGHNGVYAGAIGGRGSTAIVPPRAIVVRPELRVRFDVTERVVGEMLGHVSSGVGEAGDAVVVVDFVEL